MNKPVQRPWGSYQTLDGGINAGYQVKRIEVEPGQKLSLQYHHKRSEHWIVVKGKATAQVGERVLELDENQSAYIHQGMKHRLENRTEQLLVIIEVQVGEYLAEDDIVRLEDAYGRV